QADFQLELFIYVQRVSATTGIRRATEARVGASAAAIRELLERQGNDTSYGPASQRYWAISLFPAFRPNLDATAPTMNIEGPRV
ncbi:hypothetical protein PHMEG_00035067, partial [Phytophthora megakarya]